jgi:hypothetical protein
MPTRKQRRREQKLRRHEWEDVYVDAEGREVDPAEVEVPARNGAGAGAKATQGRARSKKAPAQQQRTRGVQPPSWGRVLRRGAIFAPLMFVTVHLIAGDELTLAGKLTQTAFLLLVFLPFSYLMDTVTYRMWQRRQRTDAQRAAKR